MKYKTLAINQVTMSLMITSIRRYVSDKEDKKKSVKIQASKTNQDTGTKKYRHHNKCQKRQPDNPRQ